jgi:hypothetical protein
MSDLERRIEELERESIMHRRLGPSPWYPYSSQAEKEEADKEFVDSLVAKFKEGNKMNGAVLRLKCVVSSVKSVADSNGDKSQEELALSAVYSGSEANKQWSKYTPSASLTMTISNPAAFGKVLPGQFVFVDLTPTDKES